MKKVWSVSEWTRGDVKTFLSIDYRDYPDKTPMEKAKPLIQIPVTDRYTIEEYREIARLIADRMNAWEVEQKLVE